MPKGSYGLKLVVSEDPLQKLQNCSGSAIWVSSLPRRAKDLFSSSGETNHKRWKVVTLSAQQAVISTEEKTTEEVIQLLAVCNAEYLLVPIGDCVHLMNVITQPRIRLDLEESHIEYFEPGPFYQHIVENFLRALNLTDACLAKASGKDSSGN